MSVEDDNRQAALKAALDSIALDRPQGETSHGTFDLADEVIRQFGEQDLANRVYAAIPLDVPWEDVAYLFAIFIWSTSDNGHALTETTQQWLREGDEVRKMLIALNLDVYPFLEEREMVDVLTKIQDKSPELRIHCLNLIRWRAEERLAREKK